MKRLIAASLFTVLAIAGSSALADTKAGGAATEVTSTPADDAVLAQAPANITLTFKHPVTLETVSVSGPAGPAPIRFARASAPLANYTIPLPTLSSGAYEVRWTASGDSHLTDGRFHFTVR